MTKKTAYRFDADLGQRGVRRITVQAYGPNHARVLAFDALEKAGYTVVRLTAVRPESGAHEVAQYHERDVYTDLRGVTRWRATGTAVANSPRPR